jgi:hypothetical protein
MAYRSCTYCRATHHDGGTHCPSCGAAYAVDMPPDTTDDRVKICPRCEAYYRFREGPVPPVCRECGWDLSRPWPDRNPYPDGDANAEMQAEMPETDRILGFVGAFVLTLCGGSLVAAVWAYHVGILPLGP